MLNPQFSIPLWRLDVEGYRRHVTRHALGDHGCNCLPVLFKMRRRAMCLQGGCVIVDLVEEHTVRVAVLEQHVELPAARLLYARCCVGTGDPRVSRTWHSRAVRAANSPAPLGQPSYCRTCKPAFQSLTYISPSGITSTSHVIAHLATLGRGSMRRVGTGGIQYAISLGWNWFLMSNTRTPAV